MQAQRFLARADDVQQQRETQGCRDRDRRVGDVNSHGSYPGNVTRRFPRAGRRRASRWFCIYDRSERPSGRSSRPYMAAFDR